MGEPTGAREGRPGRRPVTRVSSAHELERYASRFARRTLGMRSSVMRDLMAVTAQPEVISLAGGLPDTSSFPPETFAAVMTRVAHESSAEALQYGPTDGFLETKQCICEVMEAEGVGPDPDQILVTTGGQQALDLLTKTFVDPGDPILCEAPTYPGALPTFSAYEADVIHIETDESGLRIDALEETLDRLDSKGRQPKFLYSVATFQNPSGVTLTGGRRQALVDLARERDLLVVEDNPYGLLRYDGAPEPTLLALDGGGHVIYVGTFSKILSPGIRLGWVVAPPPVLEKLGLGKQGTDLCTSTLTQYMVREYFRGERWESYIESVIEIYRGRRDAMFEALERHFPSEATWTTPEGGLFVWATLPDYIDTTDLLARALREDVAFVPGEGAFVDGRGRNSMRLNFSGSSEEEIREGIRRIGAAVAEQIELYELLGGRAAKTSGAPSGPEAPAADVLPMARLRRRRSR